MAITLHTMRHYWISKRLLLRRVDKAIARRVQLIPYVVHFNQPNLLLTEKLRVEWSGILQWMIEACLIWQRQALQPPEKVLKATEEYLRDQDDIELFLDAC